LMEEIVFRGLLYGALRTRMAPWPAAGASAVLFGTTHFYGLPGFMGVTLFGFWCAVAREKTGSLLPGIASHMAVTGLLLCLSGFITFVFMLLVHAASRLSNLVYGASGASPGATPGRTS